MRKQHFDLLPLAARGAVSISFGDVARHVPCALEDAAGDFPSRLLRAAVWLERAAIAVVFAGAIQELVFVHDGAVPIANVVALRTRPVQVLRDSSDRFSELNMARPSC